ncbi:MAG: extracellular solute-binding protein [Firmicutes bacterium]|nr:extracellular solute-binding protein [Bacillota bacterium]
MKRLYPVLGLLLVLVLSAGVLAYESDRMDFGDIDFGGATVTVVAHFDNLAAFYEGGARAGRLEEAKKLFNIGDIQLITAGWDEVGELALNRYLSGDSKYDLWRLPHRDFFTLATRGAFYPVSDILPPEYFENLSPFTREKNLRLPYNGKLLHFSVGTPDDYGHAPFCVVNLDLFERENLPDPIELYLNHEWTWDVVEEIGIKVTRDTDGDGEVDQWGLAFIDPMMIIFSNGGAITRLGDDGRVYFTMDEPQVLDALRKLAEWENNLGISYGDWQMREWSTGRTAMAFIPFWQIDATQYDFNYAILPLPMGPAADDYVHAPGVADAIFIPANSAYPLGMIALDNFLFPLEDYHESMEDMIRDRARDQVSYQVMHKVFAEPNGDAAYYHNFLGAWYEGETPYGGIIMGIKGGAAPATVVGQFKAQGQAMIDEYLNQ